MTTDVSENTSAVPFDPKNSALREAMAKYGVVPAAVVAPTPKVVAKVNFEAICTLTTPVVDSEGNSLGAKSHSGTLMYLSTRRTTADENPKFKTRYDKYIGFFVYTVFHPQRGEIVITHGIPETGPTELSEFISTLEPGNLFCVGLFETSGGNRLFKAVPVQS